MILDVAALDAWSAAEFGEATGWEAKPEGMCRGAVCVPAPNVLRSDSMIDVRGAAERLGMPVVIDDAHQLAALGPATFAGTTLVTAVADDPVLIDRHGQPFRLSSLRGRKVILAAWSTY